MPYFTNRGIMALSTEDAATAAWVAAVEGDGGSVSAGRRTLVNTLISGLKSDGVWTHLDRLWIFAAENSQSALRDLVGTNLASLLSTPTFTADDGYTMAPSKGIQTGFNPTTASGLYVQNSAHISFWAFDTPTTGEAAIGQPSGGTNIYPSFGGSVFMRVNDSPETGGFAVSNGPGFFLGNRSSSTGRQGYINNSSIGSYGSSSSGAPNNETILVGNTNYATTISSASIGESVDSVRTAFYDRLRTYMTAVGVP